MVGMGSFERASLYLAKIRLITLVDTQGREVFNMLHDKKEFFFCTCSDIEKSEVLVDSRGEGSFQ